MGNQIQYTGSFPFCSCDSSTIVDEKEKSNIKAPIQPGNEEEKSQIDMAIFLDSSKPTENANINAEISALDEQQFQNQMEVLRLPTMFQGKGIFQSAYYSKIVETENPNQEQELNDQQKQQAEALRLEEERQKAIEEEIKLKKKEEENLKLQIERENELKFLKEKQEQLQKLKTQEIELNAIREKELEIQKQLSLAAEEARLKKEKEEYERQLKLQEQLREQQSLQRIENKILKEKEIASQNMLQGFVHSDDFIYNGPYYFYNEKVMPHGEGRILFQGRNYSINGKFIHGKMLAINSISFQDKSTYVGETYNEVPHGKGVHKAVDDSWSYEGMFQNGLKHGQGIMKFENKIFEGEFHDNKLTGKFKVTSGLNGDVYEGDLVDMQRHGEGILRNSQGKVLYEGQFVNGIFQKKK